MSHSWAIDSAAVAGIAGALWGAIPKVAALVGGFYYCLLVYEWFKHRGHRHTPETDHDGS